MQVIKVEGVDPPPGDGPSRALLEEIDAISEGIDFRAVDRESDDVTGADDVTDVCDVTEESKKTI